MWVCGEPGLPHPGLQTDGTLSPSPLLHVSLSYLNGVGPLPGTYSMGLGMEGAWGVCCNQSQESGLEGSLWLLFYIGHKKKKKKKNLLNHALLLNINGFSFVMTAYFTVTNPIDKSLSMFIIISWSRITKNNISKNIHTLLNYPSEKLPIFIPTNNV